MGGWSGFYSVDGWYSVDAAVEGGYGAYVGGLGGRHHVCLGEVDPVGDVYLERP